MRCSIFYPHPPKDDGFSSQGGSDFSFKESHKILTFQTNFSKVPTKKEPTFRFLSTLRDAGKKWNLSTHDQTVVNNMAERSKKTTSLLIN